MSTIADGGGSGGIDTVAPSKTYRLSRPWRVFVAAVYIVLLCGAVGGICVMLMSASQRPAGAVAVACLVLAAFAAGTVWQLVIFLTWQATLTEDAIETSSWWSRRRLRRDQIEGLRLRSTGQGGRVLTVVPASAGLKKITLALRFMQTDPAFSAWFAGLRNLDAEGLQQSLAAIAANPAYGATPEQRLRRLQWARWIARGLDIAALAAVAWAFLWPQPYALLIATLAALPALAMLLVVMSRGLFRIGIGPAEAHANLGTVCALPAFTIMVRVLFDLNFVDWIPLIAAAVVGAVVFSAVIAVADRGLRGQPWMLVGLALVAGAYALGAIGEADALLDGSAASVFQTRILEKHATYGKTTTYHLRLAPWGPVTEPGDVAVSHALYDRLEPGNPACLVLRGGALRMPWFVVLACR